MFQKFIHTLESLKMTMVSGIFLLIAVLFMIFNISSPIDPAWGAVIISGIPLVYLAFTRLIYEKWVSSALLIVIAMFASLFIGQVFAAGEVVWIMALGALLEDWTVERAKKGLKNLIELKPKKARIIKNGVEKEVLVSEIRLSDIVRILPGETIPIDGKVIKGNSSIDQSIITGESLPVDKQIEDEVFCGTLNLYGTLDVEVTSLAEESSLQKLINLIKAADEKQAPTQRIADKWATWLVPVALLIAIVATLVTGNLERGVTVLVVFCPCALILATPTAVMAAIGQATKHGVLIKSGEALETLGSLNTIAFDKTGTLTYGDIEVSDIIVLDENTSEYDLLELAAISESRSQHPLGKAIVNHFEGEIGDVDDFKYIPGKGVIAVNNNKEIISGNLSFIKENNVEFNEKLEENLNILQNQGKASVIVACDRRVIGIVGLNDILKEDSSLTIKRLEEMGSEIILLTGDNSKAGNYLASKLGISKVFGDLLPQDKVAKIEEIKKSGKKVCMIGDGVNDAPALKTADVSIAMGTMGSDIAIDAADIALLGDDIEKLPYLKKLSNSTLFTIKANIAISMIINAVAIICSVLGFLNPVTGAIVHNAGSCLVVLNAALLYDRHFDKDINNNEDKKYHIHRDGEKTHSHENVEIVDEMEFDGGIKHSHIPKRNCEKYHNL